MNLKNLFLVGLNHLDVPLKNRERAAVKEPETEGIMHLLRASAGLSEVVVLSTCSRVEIYAAAEDAATASRSLLNWLLGRAGAEIEPGIYLKRDDEAARHLFRVASGLDSWIIGESEIIAQVKRAYQFALEKKSTGSVLNQVFQRAIAVGKLVRTKTGIQNGIHSIGGAAALLAKRIFDQDAQGRVVVFGAGEAAEAVTRHLAAKSFKDVCVANRTLERAQEIAATLGGQAVTFERGMSLLSSAEAVIFSTSCPRPLLEAEALKPLLAARRRPLFLIDLGMPRNVDPACGGLSGVYLYNLDDLKEIVKESMSRKAAEKEKAELLAALALAEFVEEAAASESRKLAAAGRTS